MEMFHALKPHDNVINNCASNGTFMVMEDASFITSTYNATAGLHQSNDEHQGHILDNISANDSIFVVHPNFNVFQFS